MMSYVARASIGRPIMMELRSLTCNYSCVSPKPAVYRYVQELVGESTSLEVGIG